MIAGIRLKVCGLTSLVDAEFVDQCGADYLGFNLYAQSPRFVSLEQYRGMASLLPAREKVAVTVEPSPVELKAMQSAGFDYFQVHFMANTDREEITAWSEAVGADHLWLAPKLPPGKDIPAQWLELADYCLMDTFAPDKFGGSGETGDWDKFARHQTLYPTKHWILAGGLAPENISEAIRASGTKFVDVNSGVESAPGVKDQAKLKQFVSNLRRGISE